MWIFWVDCKCSHECICKRKAEGDLLTDRRGEGVVILRDESNTATSQGMRAAMRSWERSAVEPPRRSAALLTT